MRADPRLAALAVLIVAGCASVAPPPEPEARACEPAGFVPNAVSRPVCRREVCREGKVALEPDLTALAPVDDWAEERFCVGQPFTCLKAYRMKEESEVWLKTMVGKRWQKDEVRYGIGDAVRHAFIMCRIAERFGAEFARGLGVAHEDDSGYLLLSRMGEPYNRCCEREMDLFNNEVGIALAAEPGACEDKVFASLERLRHSLCPRAPDIILGE